MQQFATALGALWTRRGPILLRAATIVLAVAATVWLAYQGWRLLLQPGVWGAVDLGNYHRLVGDWFAGRPIYAERTAVHPPATYLFMWPFVGWLPFQASRWLWGALLTIALGILIRAGIRMSGAVSRDECVLIGLLFLGTYPVGATIGNGQLGVHLLAGLMLLHDRLATPDRRRLDRAAIATLLCLCLVKPTFSVPFFLLVATRPGGFAPAAFAAAGYLAATLAATAFREEGFFAVIRAWMARAGLGHQKGNANLRAWLAAAGWEQAASLAALLVLAALAAWLLRHRTSRLDLQFAIVAIVARLFAYHRWYDDLLLLVPMVVLFRVARSDASPVARPFAGALFGAALVLMLAPGGLFLFPSPWNQVYVAALVVVWVAMLALLVLHAESDRARTAARPRSLASGAPG